MKSSSRQAACTASILSLILALISLTGCELLPNPRPLLPSATATPAEPSATFTNTPIWFPATETPTLRTSLPPPPTQDMRPAVDAMVLHDDFSIPEGWQTGVTAAGSIAFGQKELSLAVTGEKATLVSLREDPIPGNAYVEMNVLPSLCNGEDSFGLLLRSASHSTGYRLAGTCDGRLRMERLRNGEVLPLEDWSPTGTLPAGGGIPVTLGVWMNANELRVFVDQQWQFTVRDPVWSEGQVGVFARSAASGPLTVNFSGLSVYAIDATRLPSATPAP